MMCSAGDIGLVRGHIPGGVPPRPGNIERASNFVVGSTPPSNVGNIRPVQVPSEFSGIVRNMVPPDSGRFNMQHEIPRLRAPRPSSLPPGANDTDQHCVGPVPHIPPFPRGQLPGQLAGIAVEQKSWSGPSERLLTALHSLAGMQTERSQDRPPHGNEGSNRSAISDTRFIDSHPETIDTGMGQFTPGPNKMLLGPRADVSGFGSPAVRSLLPQQSRMDGAGHNLPHCSLPPPRRPTAGQPHFPLPGNIQFYGRFLAESCNCIAIVIRCCLSVVCLSVT